MIYADTNFFTSLLVEMPHSREAERLAASAGTALPITWLLRLELINALQQCVFLSKQGSQDIRLTSEHALTLEGFFLDEIEAGFRFRRSYLEESVVEAVFHQLSHRHTARNGFRAYDVLHVASALALNCYTFWSFDEKARKLAGLEGLALN
jgi:predicted nucleic acid-binding protein